MSGCFFLKHGVDDRTQSMLATTQDTWSLGMTRLKSS